MMTLVLHMTTGKEMVSGADLVETEGPRLFPLPPFFPVFKELL